MSRHRTDPPFSGQYVHVTDAGTYSCAQCGQPLFSSDAKFDSGTGWPSFSAAFDSNRVARKRDWSMLIPRTEVLCAQCNRHLGHVFGDGPAPTGERYCINSSALKFARQLPPDKTD